MIRKRETVEVVFKGEKNYCWHNQYSNRYILCKKEEDINIRGYVLKNEELSEVYTINDWRELRLKELGI
jgi:hypothetical protein